eukprot:2853512-Rhodomonas_salina.2
MAVQSHGFAKVLLYGASFQWLSTFLLELHEPVCPLTPNGCVAQELCRKIFEAGCGFFFGCLPVLDQAEMDTAGQTPTGPHTAGLMGSAREAEEQELTRRG